MAKPDIKIDYSKLSEQISDICRLLDTAQRDYKWHGDKVVELDRLTQDYLHSLELDGLKYEARAKVATQIAKCRQDRRAHKDITQALEPLIDYLKSDKGRQCVNSLKEVLGKTRKIEELMKKRKYHKKVLSENVDKFL